MLAVGAVPSAWEAPAVGTPRGAQELPVCVHPFPFPLEMTSNF